MSEWVIVLAGGEGTRLRRVTTDRFGNSVPKQYCSLAGGESLLGQTLRRAAVLAGPERVLTVVAHQHRRFWRALKSVHPGNVLVQPRNCGTAVGILLPVVEALRRDPGARVVLLPSDHYIEQEEVVAAAIGRSFASLDDEPGAVVMLGIRPTHGDPELGYITCQERRGSVSPALVSGFVEKPEEPRARALAEQGALWNTFILVARAHTLAELIEECVAGAADALRTALEHDDQQHALARVYRHLPTLDFSHDVLVHRAERLRVMPVDDCGWSDLGTPGRVAACLQRLAGASLRRPRPYAPGGGWLDLSRAILPRA